MALTDKLKAIADAIRAKTGKTDSLTLDQMVAEITGITTGSDDIPFIYGGVNAEKIAEYDEEFTLADTSFTIGSFSSTTATSIKATTSNRFTTSSVAIGDKDIVVIQYCISIPQHDGANGKAQQLGYAHRHIAHISKRRTVTNATPNTRQVTNTSVVGIRYKNTSGVDTLTSASYGLYCTCQAPSVASTTASSTTIRVSSPVLYARVSSSYESAANMKLVTDCLWSWHVDVYLVDSQSTQCSRMVNDSYEYLMSLPVAYSFDDDFIEVENEE